MASISNMLPTEVTVIRDGDVSKFVHVCIYSGYVLMRVLCRVSAPDLVSGDLIKIIMGSKVPADVRLLDVSSDLRFDRSILTGESKAIGSTVDSTDPNCTP